MSGLDEISILSTARAPIAGTNPCGSDIAEDIRYISVLDEMGKLDRVGADEPIWSQIERDSLDLITEKSKDVEIAVALGHALFKLHGYSGLSAALALLLEWVNSYWDGLFPVRPRRRLARVEAFADRFTDGGWFRLHQPKSSEFDAVDACLGRLNDLKGSFASRLPKDELPKLDKFEAGLKELASRRPKTAASSSDGSATVSDSSPRPVSASQGSFEDAGGAAKSILVAAGFLTKTDSTDPRPYAVVRAMKWARLSLPTTDEAKYQIESPESSQMEALEFQAGKGLWKELLEQAESAFRSNDPLWLDLQRYTCMALNGLGLLFEAARQAVTAMTATLVTRLGPGVYDLKFRNGKPLCGGETRMWIESEAAPRVIGTSSGVPGNGRLGEATDKARQLAGSGKLKEAVGALQEGLVTAPEGRERFMWRLRIAQLLFDSRRLQLATPLLEECHDEIVRYHLDEWEPTLAVDVAQALYRCRKTLMNDDKAKGPEAMARVQDSFRWLCQLDPLAALAAEPSTN